MNVIEGLNVQFISEDMKTAAIQALQVAERIAREVGSRNRTEFGIQKIISPADGWFYSTDIIAKKIEDLRKHLEQIPIANSSSAEDLLASPPGTADGSPPAE